MFFYNKTLLQFLNWGIIKYSEERPFLSVFYNLFGGEDEEFIGGYFKDGDHFFLDGIKPESDMRDCDENGTCYKGLIFFFGKIDFTQIEEYKRTKKIILEVFADISALSMTVLEFFAYISSNFYSGNFDNYKIIEKVPSKEKKYIRNRNKNISEEKDDNKKKIELNYNTGKTEALIKGSGAEEESDKIIEIKKEGEGFNEEENPIPKLRFIGFMFNSIYSDKCCKSSNRQQIISSCNDLVSKYYTVEEIIYNQMKIENLLKDYKWNDTKLKNIENNDFFIELKGYYNIS